MMTVIPQWCMNTGFLDRLISLVITCIAFGIQIASLHHRKTIALFGKLAIVFFNYAGQPLSAILLHLQNHYSFGYI